MDDRSSQSLFKETRLNLEPDSPSSIVVLHISGHARPTQRSRRPARPPQPWREQAAEDETSFAREHLASSATLYFRRTRRYPRSLLWRVLGGRKVLSLQFLDIVKSPDDGPDASRELRIVFPDSIRLSGVAAADSENHETLDVFVLTVANDLYTIPLKPELFQRNPSRSESLSSSTALTKFDSGPGWYQAYLSPSFNFRHPHRLVARNPHELVVTLHDGGLLKLTRSPGKDGHSWDETFDSEGSWGSSLRSLIPWQGHRTITHGNISLEESTITSTAFCYSDDDRTKELLFGVTLDNKLKAWNLSSGKVEASRDLLNRENQPHEPTRFLIDPSYTDLVTAVDQKAHKDGELCYLATYSPMETGQFKFWVVAEADRSGIEIRDLHPNDTFEPLPASSELWVLAHFKLVPSDDYGLVELWVLWKNNMNYKVESLKFDILRPLDAWQRPWTFVAAESLGEVSPPFPVENQLTHPTDDWVEHIFYPGRFTGATLATALSIYERNLHLPKTSSGNDKTGLEERICSAVASAVALGRQSDARMDYERFQLDTDFQWRRYYRVVTELNKQRSEAVSFAFDCDSRMPWIISSDGVAALRHCNELELLWHNKSDFAARRDGVACESLQDTLGVRYRAGIDRVAALLIAASFFRGAFSETLLKCTAAALQSEVTQDVSDAVDSRIRDFYDRCGFGSLVSDEDYNQLARAVDVIGGFKSLDTALFENVVHLTSSRRSYSPGDLALTLFGETMVVRGAQEMIHLNGTILTNLLYLLVFIEIEENDVEEKSLDIDTPSIFLNLIRLLRENAVLGWLAKTARSEKPQNDGANGDLMVSEENAQSGATRDGRVSTILRFPFVRNWKPLWLQPSPSMHIVLTKYIDDALSGIGLADRDRYEQQVMWLQRTFIRRGDTDLALQFLRFQPVTAWSAYITARLYLLTGEDALAAGHFRKAAFNLAHREGISKLYFDETEDLLRREDAQSFNAGVAKYYLHVAQLCETEQAFAVAAELASIGLQYTIAVPREDRKSVQAQLLNAAFHAYLKIYCYDEAYSAMMRMADESLQRPSLGHLITRMSEQNEGSHLVSFPFLGLQDAVDEFLLGKCRTQLNISSGPPYHSILYAWRLKRGNFRGAAAVLDERLQRLKTVSFSEKDPEHSALTQAYLALINTLATLRTDQAWIISSAPTSKNEGRGRDTGEISLQPASSTDDRRGTDLSLSALSLRQQQQQQQQQRQQQRHPQRQQQVQQNKQSQPQQQRQRRNLTTLADVRRQYQEELDRIAAIETDQFSFAVVDADTDSVVDMDVGLNMDMDIGEDINGAHVAVSARDVGSRQDGKDAGMTMMMDVGEARGTRQHMHVHDVDAQMHDGKRDGEATRFGMEMEMDF